MVLYIFDVVVGDVVCLYIDMYNTLTFIYNNIIKLLIILGSEDKDPPRSRTQGAKTTYRVLGPRPRNHGPRNHPWDTVAPSE